MSHRTVYILFSRIHLHYYLLLMKHFLNGQHGSNMYGLFHLHVNRFLQDYSHLMLSQDGFHLRRHALLLFRHHLKYFHLYGSYAASRRLRLRKLLTCALSRTMHRSRSVLAVSGRLTAGRVFQCSASERFIRRS